ncbi:MAG: serine/threonine protein kinase, partial [Actinomycetes bacterium]
GADTGWEAQLNRESAVLGKLSHPHLLRNFGVVSTDRGPALLMDYAPGGSLHHLVAARGRLSVGETITILAPIAQALAYLHYAAVQHGDVAPGNVLFTAEGKPLLADLGTGRRLGESGLPSPGTPGFADPVPSDDSSPGYASDIFSLAAVGWYCLTGNAPARGRERIPLSLLVPEVTSELLQLLEAGLQEDPKQRPSARELADAVLRCAAPEPLDLVPAVHPSVLPELLTRRARGDEVRSGLRGFSLLPKTVPSLRLSFSPWRSSRKDGRRPAQSGRRRAQSRRADTGGKSAVVSCAAALLVLGGTLLIGPHVPGMVAPDAGHERAGGQGSGVTTQGATDLSPQMRDRVADADPVKALSALVAVRAMAMATADADLLSQVNIEGSEAMAADQEIVSGLQDRGLVFNGLSIRLREAELTDSITVPEGSVAVAARAVMSGYTETDSTGRIVRRIKEPVPQDLVFVLEHRDERWKIARVHSGDTV